MQTIMIFNIKSNQVRSRRQRTIFYILKLLISYGSLMRGQDATTLSQKTG